MSSQTTAGPATAYFLLSGFRAFNFVGGILFSLSLRSISSLVIHAVTLLLVAAECAAAQRSMTVFDLRQRRLWTAAHIALYAATFIALVGCFLAPREIWSPDGFPKFPSNPGDRLLYVPDVLAAVTSVAAFFTVPALRIRHWHSLPRDEGLFVGDAIPVAVYSDLEYEDGDEGGENGPLAAAFRAQQEDRRYGRDDENNVTLV